MSAALGSRSGRARPPVFARVRSLRAFGLPDLGHAAVALLLSMTTACLPSFAPLAECYSDVDCPNGQSCLGDRCGLPDASVPDGGRSDSGAPDATARDAGSTDAANLDAAAPDSGYLCPDGPYGTGRLYFGALAPTADFDGAKGQGALSADGLHFIKGEGGECPDCYHTIDFTRASLDGAWFPLRFDIWFWADHLRLTGDALGLFGCHGGGLKCGYHSRPSALVAFAPEADFAFYDVPGFDVHVEDGGAIDFAMLPTPDGRVLAFASNRRSAAEDVRDVPASVDTTDLWTARAIEPGNPRAGFDHLVRHPLASSPVARDFPEWIADDGSMIVLLTRAAGDTSLDLAVTSSIAGAFGPPERIAILSDRTEDEDGFSIPSLHTLGTNGGRGTGYVRRTHLGGSPAYYAFPVCIGTPSP